MRRRLVEALSDREIYSMDRFAAWPSISCGRQGEVHVVFSGKREFHVDPFGEIVLLSTDDEGEHWSDPMVLESTPLDNRDPGIVQLRSGEWLVSLFSSIAYMDWVERTEELYGEDVGASWRHVIERTTPQQIEHYCGRFLQRYRSLDPPVPMGDGLVDTVVNAPHGPVELTDGRLLMIGIDDRTSPAMVCCVCSEDGGEQWRVLSDISAYRLTDEISLHEPHLIELEEGRLLAFFRTNVPEGAPQLLYRAWSDDGGRSWSTPVATDIEGVPPHLIRCRDGELVLTYAYRKPPYSIRVTISTDGGNHWETPRTLMEIEDDRLPENMGVDDEDDEVCYQMPDFGYPASVQLASGKMMTVYYGPAQAGENTTISVLTWHL